MKFKLSLIAAAIAASSSAYAAPNIDGQFGVSVARHSYSNTETPASGTSPSVAANALVNVNLSNDTRAVLEINSEVVKLSGNKAWDRDTPTKASLYSARFERDFVPTTLSFFAGIASTNANDDGIGHVLGASAKYTFNSTTTGYLTLGSAKIIGDNSDKNGFNGTFGEVGLVQAVNDRLALKPFYGYGRAKDYVDLGDDGKYWNAGIQASYKIPLGVFITASYEQAKFIGYEDSGNSATDKRIKLGIILPFGVKAASPAGTLNPLSVPLTPVRASAYGELLD